MQNKPILFLSIMTLIFFSFMAFQSKNTAHGSAQTLPQVMIESKIVEVKSNFLESEFNPESFEYQEENFCREEAEIPKDPYLKSKGSWGQDYDDQWAIKRVGFTLGENSAWHIEDGAKSPTIVAVIDTGLDWNHPDIEWSNIWNNPGEVPENGKDDDNNGYIDDVIGWNFIDMNSKPWDYDGHGTFVTGIIAAAHNDKGIAGINSGAKIMVLKALNNFGHTRASLLSEAIFYAANNGAMVINISVGGKHLTRTEQDAVDYAIKKGALVVVASGNEAVNTSDYSPAGLKGVLTVAATDIEDKRIFFSNWGQSVDIAAPGLDVLSLRARRTDMLLGIPDVDYKAKTAYVGKNTRYYRATGTSFAAPMVAATASLILANNPKLTTAQVTRMILNSASESEVAGWDHLTGYGILNATAALKADPNFFIETKINGIEVVRESSKVFLAVKGTIDSDDLKEAWIEIGKGENPETWKQVSKIKKSLREGQIAAIEAVHFKTSKVWVIRLVGEHKNGKKREVRFKLELG